MFAVDAITTNNELFIAPMAKACERLYGERAYILKMPEIKQNESRLQPVGVKSIKTNG